MLKRIAELTNIVLKQSLELSSVRSELAECKKDLQSVKKDLADLSSDRQPRGVFNFSAGNQRSAFSVGMLSATTAVSKQDTAVNKTPAHGEGQLRGRSRSQKRQRSESRPANRAVIGIGSGGTGLVPAIEKKLKKRVFVSRIAPNVAASDLYKAIRPIVKSSLAVWRLHTKHDSYSSFCLFVDESDAEAVLDRTVWSAGTVIKAYFGRLPPEQIHSKFGDMESAVSSDSTTPALSSTQSQSPFPNETAGQMQTSAD